MVRQSEPDGQARGPAENTGPRFGRAAPAWPADSRQARKVIGSGVEVGREWELADRLRREMVAGLLERGELSPRWRAAFESVARHGFIPDTIWRLDRRITDGPDLVPVHRGENPAAWLAEAYANAASP
jgi:hypothetical protein